jgi:hypothetical protein
MSKVTLKYKTFDQLLAEVKSDFEAFNLEDLIKPYQLIKVAKRVNKDLGLRINQTKNVVLDVEKHKVKLPDDFLLMNYLYGLGRYTITSPVIQGTHVEQVPLKRPEYFPGTKDIEICATAPTCPTPEPACPNPCQSPEPCGCSTCNCDTWINCQGVEMQLIQKIKTETKTWTEFYKIKLTGDTKYYDPLCPNKSWNVAHTAFIQDNYLYTSFKEGQVYINYQGLLMDKDGSLLVLDDDIINEYYEYAIKERILENLMANQENVQPQFVNRIDAKLKMARNNALSIVNTPNFSELKAVWEMNRDAMFKKYYKMFV